MGGFLSGDSMARGTICAPFLPHIFNAHSFWCLLGTSHLANKPYCKSFEYTPRSKYMRGSCRTHLPPQNVVSLSISRFPISSFNKAFVLKILSMLSKTTSLQSLMLNTEPKEGRGGEDRVDPGCASLLDAMQLPSTSALADSQAWVVLVGQVSFLTSKSVSAQTYLMTILRYFTHPNQSFVAYCHIYALPVSFLQIKDLHVAMGSPERLPLHYAWHAVETGNPPQAYATHKTPMHVSHRPKPEAANPVSDGKTPMSRPVETPLTSPDFHTPQVRQIQEPSPIACQ